MSVYGMTQIAIGMISGRIVGNRLAGCCVPYVVRRFWSS
jgi:hypothetical protein